MVTIEEVRAFAITLPRSSEGLVRGRVKFRIGRIVYLSFSRDGSTMGFAFPKEWRDALVESEPEKFSLPSQSDLRNHWVHVRLAAIDPDEMRDLSRTPGRLRCPSRWPRNTRQRRATADGERAASPAARANGA
jgi:hypothetical protein